MSDVNTIIKWRNPLFLWGAKGAVEELPTIPFRSHQQIWRETRESKAKLFSVGRLRYYYKWPGHGSMTWNRLRYWPTRRRVLRLRGEYNPKTLQREKTIVDKRPIWWLLGLLVLALGPLFTPLGIQNTLLTAASTFALYAAISLCWMLIIGTAGIYTLASYAVVGTAAFCTASLSIKFGVPWWLLPPIGAVIGLVFGGIIALPASRLDGFYYALLTLGLNELCRVYFTTSPVFGAANGGLFGAATFVPEAASQLVRLLTSYYACFALLLLALLFYRQVNGRRLGRVLRMAPEKREAFAEATGVNFRQARVRVFVLSSIALGFIGGFYTANFGGVAFSIFNFDTVLLGLGMLVIGGIGRAEGAVVGTFIVVLFDKFFITLGPIRLISDRGHHVVGSSLSARRIVRDQGAVPQLARQEKERTPFHACREGWRDAARGSD